MLVLDYRQRFTARKCLEHPFFDNVAWKKVQLIERVSIFLISFIKLEKRSIYNF